MPEVASLPRVHVYDRESLESCAGDILPLAARHFAETERFKSKGLSPDLGVYQQIETAGSLRTFTIREIASHALIGYCLMIVRRHHHTKQIRAFEDLLYVVPESRGIGSGFVNWIDGQLASEGVEVVQRTCQISHNHGRMFERLGYDKTEETWSRKIDGDTHG
jgi:hypothetical protein